VLHIADSHDLHVHLHVESMDEKRRRCTLWRVMSSPPSRYPPPSTAILIGRPPLTEPRSLRGRPAPSSELRLILSGSMSSDDARAGISGRSTLDALPGDAVLATLSDLAAENAESAVAVESTLSLRYVRGVDWAEKGRGIVKLVPGNLKPVLGEVMPSGVAVEPVITEGLYALGEVRSKRTPRDTRSVRASVVVGERLSGAREERSIVNGRAAGLRSGTVVTPGLSGGG